MLGWLRRSDSMHTRMDSSARLSSRGPPSMFATRGFSRASTSARRDSSQKVAHESMSQPSSSERSLLRELVEVLAVEVPGQRA